MSRPGKKAPERQPLRDTLAALRALDEWEAAYLRSGVGGPAADAMRAAMLGFRGLLVKAIKQLEEKR